MDAHFFMYTHTTHPRKKRMSSFTDYSRSFFLWRMPSFTRRIRNFTYYFVISLIVEEIITQN